MKDYCDQLRTGAITLPLLNTQSILKLIPPLFYRIELCQSSLRL